MFNLEDIRKAEGIIKRELMSTGRYDLSVDEVIWLYKRTNSWDKNKWIGIQVPEGIGRV